MYEEVAASVREVVGCKGRKKDKWDTRDNMLIVGSWNIGTL